jgi:hypothetical protein
MRIVFCVSLLLVAMTKLQHTDSMERTLKRLQRSETPREQPLLQSRRALVVGLVGSLQELYQYNTKNDNNVVDSIGRLCSSAFHRDQNGDVEVHVLYRNDHSVNYETTDPHEFQTKLRRAWETAGCHVTLVSEEDAIQQPDVAQSFLGFSALSRYKKLAKLRSLQRRLILDREATSLGPKFEVVMNLDFDVTVLPRPSTVHAAVDYVARTSQRGSKRGDRHGSIVCANGFEIWKLKLWEPHLFYDTLAAIDEQGTWYYPFYACNVFRLITFAQTSLFKRILSFGPTSNNAISSSSVSTAHSDSVASTMLWPMQSCFGGLTIYDWDTWAYPECDYDESQITLAASAMEDRTPSEYTADEPEGKTWYLSPKYTMSWTRGGNACEHVVFQQCLRAAAAGSSHKPDKLLLADTLEIGIMPELVVER